MYRILALSEVLWRLRPKLYLGKPMNTSFDSKVSKYLDLTWLDPSRGLQTLGTGLTTHTTKTPVFYPRTCYRGLET